jgi:uncharacterized protein (DUF1810 family)
LFNILNVLKKLKMTQATDSIDNNDPFDLNRFINAQKRNYDAALSELKNGKKQTHWMWYVFPQLDGLAQSSTSKYYAIKSVEEARQYLNHPLLGNRLLACTQAVLAIEGRTVLEIFGYPDDSKLKSSMTLFASVAKSPLCLNVFLKNISKANEMLTRSIY